MKLIFGTKHLFQNRGSCLESWRKVLFLNLQILLFENPGEVFFSPRKNSHFEAEKSSPLKRKI